MRLNQRIVPKEHSIVEESETEIMITVKDPEWNRRCKDK